MQGLAEFLSCSVENIIVVPGRWSATEKNPCSCLTTGSFCLLSAV